MDEDEIREEGLTLIAHMGGALDPEGTAWEVTICEPGLTRNGWHHPEDALRQAADAGVFENCDVNLYELPQGFATHVPDALFDIKTLLVKNKVGWIDTVKHVAGRGLQGVLHFLDSAKALGRNLLTAKTKGDKVYGLSYDANVRAKRDEVEGRKVFNLEKFLAVDSVDIVTRPAAGGKFIRAVASQGLGRHKEVVMDKEQLWDLIHEKRPDLLEGKDKSSVTDEEIAGLARMAMAAPEGAEAQGAGRTAQGEGEQRSKQDEPGSGGTGEPEPDSGPSEVEILRCEMALDKKLAGAELMPELAEDIRERFAGKVFEAGELDKAVGRAKDIMAKMAEPHGGGHGDDYVPASSIRAGIDDLERAQMALDRMLDLTRDDVTELAALKRVGGRPFFEARRSAQDLGGYDDVPAFEGLLDAYIFFTGDAEVRGDFDPRRISKSLRTQMDLTSTTFTYVLGNTLARRLVKDYREPNWREDLLVSIRKNVKDFRQQEAVNVGYFPDIADVDPETAEYDEITGVTDEESTYTVGQKGNLFTVTRKTIINDDLSIVQRLVTRLGKALRRTHAKYVWNKFINNSTCSDGTAWFTGGHGNLGSTGLDGTGTDYATVLTAYIALAQMTEKDSGERIGLLSDPGVKPTLVYPSDIMAYAESVVSEEDYYSSNDLTTKKKNPLYGKIAGAMIDLFTDANDWGLLLPPSVVDMVEMGYLQGRQEPEFFVADSPQSEQVFVADKIRYKFRHEYAGAVVDYRSGYKASVT